MRMSLKGVFVALVAVAALSLPITAATQTVEDAVSAFTYTKNMKPQGYSPRVVPLTGGVRHLQLGSRILGQDGVPGQLYRFPDHRRFGPGEPCRAEQLRSARPARRRAIRAT